MVVTVCIMMLVFKTVLFFLLTCIYLTLSGNTLRVGYHLCIRHILGTAFELYQSSENTHRYFQIIKAKNIYRPPYAAYYYCLLVICLCLKLFVDI